MTDTTSKAIVLSAYFGYRDADAAIDWLGRAFGFEVTLRFGDEDGGVAHAELRLGDAAIVVFSDRDGYERPPRQGDTLGSGSYLVLPGDAEVDALHARATEAGATVIWAPQSTEWGNYRCRFADPEGFEWTFGTHRPGEPVVADWDES